MAAPAVAKKSNKATEAVRGAWVSDYGQLSFGRGTNNEVPLTQEEYDDLKAKAIPDRIAFYTVRAAELNSKKPVVETVQEKK